MIFHQSLCNSKSTEVYKTLLSILAGLFPLIFCSSSLFARPLGSVQITPTIIGITVTFMSHRFFSSLTISKYLLFFFFLLSFIFTRWSVGTAQSTRFHLRFSFLNNVYVLSSHLQSCQFITWSIHTVVFLLISVFDIFGFFICYYCYW